MPQITNRLNLPEVFVNVLLRDEYNRGKADISATSLLLPPRIFRLRERHSDEIEEDVSDAIWKIFGKAIHKIKEEGAPLESLPEERLYYECNGWTVSAAIDLYFDNGLDDYKVTSLWTIVYGSRKEEWHWQLEINRVIWVYYGFEINRLRNICLLRDWSKYQAKINGRCPDNQVYIENHELRTLGETHEFLRQQIEKHQAVVSLSDKQLPLCSPEDRWHKDDKWALIKDGRKTALKICTKEEEAESLLSLKWKGATGIEHRPGEDVRCKEYCEVNKFCDYWHLNVKEKP